MSSAKNAQIRRKSRATNTNSFSFSLLFFLVRVRTPNMAQPNVAHIMLGTRHFICVHHQKRFAVVRSLLLSSELCLFLCAARVAIPLIRPCDFEHIHAFPTFIHNLILLYINPDASSDVGTTNTIISDSELRPESDLKRVKLSECDNNDNI